MHKLDEELDDILKHWGVKGMKWDETKRKDQDALNELVDKYNLSPEEAANVQALAAMIKAKKEQGAPAKTKDSKELDKLADDVIKGKYGNGEERKKKLGDKYDKIQAMVNEKLKKGGPGKTKSSSSKKKSSSKPKPKTVSSGSKPKPKKKGTPSYQHATVQSAKKKKAYVKKIKKKLKPKKKPSYFQTLKSKTTKEINSWIKKLFGK